jgi:hypothetical protein
MPIIVSYDDPRVLGSLAQQAGMAQGQADRLRQQRSIDASTVAREQERSIRERELTAALAARGSGTGGGGGGGGGGNDLAVQRFLADQADRAEERTARTALRETAERAKQLNLQALNESRDKLTPTQFNAAKAAVVAGKEIPDFARGLLGMLEPGEETRNAAVGVQAIRALKGGRGTGGDGNDIPGEGTFKTEGERGAFRGARNLPPSELVKLASERQGVGKDAPLSERAALLRSAISQVASDPTKTLEDLQTYRQGLVKAGMDNESLSAFDNTLAARDQEMRIQRHVMVSTAMDEVNDELDELIAGGELEAGPDAEKKASLLRRTKLEALGFTGKDWRDWNDDVLNGRIPLPDGASKFAQPGFSDIQGASGQMSVSPGDPGTDPNAAPGAAGKKLLPDQIVQAIVQANPEYTIEPSTGRLMMKNARKVGNRWVDTRTAKMLMTDEVFPDEKMIRILSGQGGAGTPARR